MNFRSSFIILLLIASQVFSQNEALKAADSLNAVGKTSEAINLLKSLPQTSEKSLQKLAEFQRFEGYYDEAIENYRMLLQKNPERILSALSYGELLLEADELVAADSLFSDLTEKYPNNASFRFRMGLVHEKQNDSSAIKDFFETVKLDSTHQGALYKCAKFELQNGRHFNASKLAKTGLRVNPNNVSLLSILGQAYSMSFQFEKAIVPYEKLISLHEASEFILEKLGKAYRVTEETQKAIRTYKMLLGINDTNASAHSNLGVLYLKQNKIEKAQQHFTMALLIKKQPVDREYVNIGITFKRQENFQEAYTNFQKALEENPENQRALLELAIAADAYFKDKEAVLNLYENFHHKYAETGRKDMLSIAEYRISALKKEIHMAE